MPLNEGYRLFVVLLQVMMPLWDKSKYKAVPPRLFRDWVHSDKANFQCCAVDTSLERPLFDSIVLSV